jgi:GT2 family glycosyltransferase
MPTSVYNQNADVADARSTVLSIVLVCWNNITYLKPCLASLYQDPPHCPFDVVVVDNGSTDGSQEMLRRDFPQVCLIQNSGNVGLGRASNQGIEATKGRYVLLLNNDTLVNGRGFDAMVAFLDQHLDAGAAGGRLLNPDGSFQSGYAEFPSIRQEALIASGIGARIWGGYPSHGKTDSVASVDWLSSACLMVRRAALNQVGLLDDSYFIYGDEVDLQFRLKVHGWRVYYLPEVAIVHYGGRSLDRWRRRKMVNRGKLLFFQKNYGRVRTVLLRALLAGLSAAKALIWTALSVVPVWHVRAQQELQSNLDVLRLCWKTA